jgi:hypothetical protein
MTPRRKTLSPRQEKAALDTATGFSVGQVAERCGVTTRCVYYWRSHAVFMDRVHGLQREAFAQAAGLLVTLGQTAALQLGELLKSRNELVRLSAARAVLEAGPRLWQALNLAEQVEALTRQVEEMQRARQLPNPAAGNGKAGGHAGAPAGDEPSHPGGAAAGPLPHPGRHDAGPLADEPDDPMLTG